MCIQKAAKIPRNLQILSWLLKLKAQQDPEPGSRCLYKPNVRKNSVKRKKENTPNTHSLFLSPKLSDGSKQAEPHCSWLFDGQLPHHQLWTGPRFHLSSLICECVSCGHRTYRMHQPVDFDSSRASAWYMGLKMHVWVKSWGYFRYLHTARSKSTQGLIGVNPSDVLTSFSFKV